MNLTKSDPMQAQIQNWKIRQNAVLSLFLNAYISLPAEEKEKLPVRLKEGERRYVVDLKGNELCEYSMIDKVPFVHWYRSFDDYDILDRLGRNEKHRIEAVGRDDTAGDDGGTEAKEGV